MGFDENSFTRNKEVATPNDRRVGLIFDERMCEHHAPYEKDHPECPGRIRAIWDRLNSSGLTKRCVVLNGKDAEDKHLALVHTENHIDLIKNISSISSDFKRKKIAAKYESIFFNKGSSKAAYLAAGSVIEVAEKVAKGELNSAFAIVRPPGHHAEHDQPMGFCLHNNVAVATSYLLNERRDLGINKILIVDWDVHHGNGTQKMFYDDPRVLFFSVHRYDNATFFPCTHDGSHIMTGEDQGAGYNINVPWESGECGDADYNAVWDQILIPVAKEYNPDLIIISAGFDAAMGDPLGGCRVSPYGFSILLEKLMNFAGGKIVMALEGGYNLKSTENSAHACVEVLLQGKRVAGSLEGKPFKSTLRVIEEVRQVLSTYWPIFAGKSPDKVVSQILDANPNSGRPATEFVASPPNVLAPFDATGWFDPAPSNPDCSHITRGEVEALAVGFPLGAVNFTDHMSQLEIAILMEQTAARLFGTARTNRLRVDRDRKLAGELERETAALVEAKKTTGSLRSRVVELEQRVEELGMKLALAESSVSEAECRAFERYITPMLVAAKVLTLTDVLKELREGQGPAGVEAMLEKEEEVWSDLDGKKDLEAMLDQCSERRRSE